MAVAEGLRREGMAVERDVDAAIVYPHFLTRLDVVPDRHFIDSRDHRPAHCDGGNPAHVNVGADSRRIAQREIRDIRCATHLAGMADAEHGRPAERLGEPRATSVGAACVHGHHPLHGPGLLRPRRLRRVGARRRVDQRHRARRVYG